MPTNMDMTKPPIKSAPPAKRYRTRLALWLREHYEAGWTIRGLAEQTGHSYGLVRTLLEQAKTPFRPRGLPVNAQDHRVVDVSDVNTTPTMRSVLPALAAANRGLHSFEVAELVPQHYSPVKIALRALCAHGWARRSAKWHRRRGYTYRITNAGRKAAAQLGEAEKKKGCA